MSTVGDSGLGVCFRIMLEKSYKMGPHKLQSMGPITPLIEVKKNSYPVTHLFELQGWPLAVINGVKNPISRFLSTSETHLFIANDRGRLSLTPLK